MFPILFTDSYLLILLTYIYEGFDNNFIFYSIRFSITPEDDDDDNNYLFDACTLILVLLLVLVLDNIELFSSFLLLLVLLLLLLLLFTFLLLLLLLLFIDLLNILYFARWMELNSVVYAGKKVELICEFVNISYCVLFCWTVCYLD